MLVGLLVDEMRRGEGEVRGAREVRGMRGEG